jgi:hypothetical protein
MCLDKINKNAFSLKLEAREMNRIDEIIYKETQKAAYEEQCEQGFVHQEQPNEDYFEGLNDYLDGTMSI